MNAAHPQQGIVSEPVLQQLRVFDAMHHGLVSCAADTPAPTVARLMVTSRVHALLVTAGVTGRHIVGIVSDHSLVRAALEADFSEMTAGDLAAVPPFAVPSNEELGQAAVLLEEKRVSHLIVTDPRTGKPIGVLSTLDVVRAAAGFPERHPQT